MRLLLRLPADSLLPGQTPAQEATWETFSKTPIPRSFVASCVSFQLRPLPSTGVTRLRRYYEPLRHPIRPGLPLTSCQLIVCAITAGTSRVAHGPHCVHAIANTPAGRMELVRSYNSIRFGLPTKPGAGRLLHHSFRGLLRVHSRYGLHARLVAFATFCTRGFSSLVASTTALIATGWSEPVSGRVFSRCGPSPFHGAPGKPVIRPPFGHNYRSTCHKELIGLLFTRVDLPMPTT